MEYQGEREVYFFQGEAYVCSLELAMNVIGGKWKSMIVYHLKEGAMRSGELQRSLPRISNKMFTQTIRELERSGLVRRIVYAVVPPRVEYELTGRGRSVLPIVLELARWGTEIGRREE